MTDQQWDRCSCCGAEYVSHDDAGLCEGCAADSLAIPNEPAPWEGDEPEPEDE